MLLKCIETALLKCIVWNNAFEKHRMHCNINTGLMATILFKSIVSTLLKSIVSILFKSIVTTLLFSQCSQVWTWWYTRKLCWRAAADVDGRLSWVTNFFVLLSILRPYSTEVFYCLNYWWEGWFSLQVPCHSSRTPTTTLSEASSRFQRSHKCLLNGEVSP